VLVVVRALLAVVEAADSGDARVALLLAWSDEDEGPAVELRLKADQRLDVFALPVRHLVDSEHQDPQRVLAG